MAKGAFQKAVLTIMKDVFRAKRFRSYRGSSFSLSRGASLDHNTAILQYRAGANHFDLVAEEGVDGGFFMNVAEMDAQSMAFSIIPVTEKIQVAKNIRSALTSQGFPCQIIADHRPLK